MSALPPKADIRGVVAECLLLTQSGHSSFRRKGGEELNNKGRAGIDASPFRY